MTLNFFNIGLDILSNLSIVHDKPINVSLFLLMPLNKTEKQPNITLSSYLNTSNHSTNLCFYICFVNPNKSLITTVKRVLEHRNTKYSHTISPKRTAFTFMCKSIGLRNLLLVERIK